LSVFVTEPIDKYPSDGDIDGSTDDDFQCDILVRLFDRTFAESENTRLFKGAEEPTYVPAYYSDSEYPACDYHRILFTRNYFASGLHEIAHWCVAGAARRQQLDYGYWYAPDGRSEAQQQAFEQVEVQPQAMEWIFTVASRRRFRVSADNLAMGLGASDKFKADIYQQVLDYCRLGLNPRALAMTRALQQHYGVDNALDTRDYALEEL